MKNRIIFIATLLASVYANAQFTRSLVDETNTIRGRMAAVYDGSDTVYYAREYKLVQAYWSGSAWTKVEIDVAGGALYPGCNRGADSVSGMYAGGYHDIYYTAPYGSPPYRTLRHAWFDFGSNVWRCEDVDMGNTFVAVNAVHSSGTSGVFYIDSATSRLKYAKFNGSWWDVETVDGPGLACNCAITDVAATTLNGADQQVFYVSPGGGLRYAYRASPSGGWYRAVLNSDAATSGGRVVATRVGSQLHSFYSTNAGTRHVWWNGSGWSHDIVSTGALLAAGAHGSSWVVVGNTLPSGKSSRATVTEGVGASATANTLLTLPAVPLTYASGVGVKSASVYSAMGYLNIYMYDFAQDGAITWSRVHQYWK